MQEERIMQSSYIRPAINSLYKNYIFWGIVLIFIYMLPNIILGQNSYLFLFDNWDSEILFYNLNAKYFFDYNGKMPEIMNGLATGSVNVFSPIQTLVYMILPSYWAYIFNDFWVRIISFLGTFLLIRKMLGKDYAWIGFLAGVILSYLPIFTVYGTSINGQPMLAYAVWNLAQNRKKIFSYTYAVFFGLSSSVVLTGYYLLPFMLIFAIIMTVKKGFRASIHIYIAIAIISFCYLLTSFKMIYNLVFLDFETMRSERVTNSINISEFFRVFFGGHMHAISVQVYAFIVLVPVIIIMFFKIKAGTLDKNDNKYLNIIWALLGYNIVAAILNSFYVEFIFKFEYRRLFFSCPVTWNIIFALSLFLLVRWQVFSKINFFDKLKKPVVCLLTVLIAFVSAFSITSIYESLPLGFNYVYFQNVKRIFYRPTINEDYITYNQYMDTKLFDQIKQHIGKDESEYKVVSVAMYPAIASMNGFYTLDGYFQMYELSYKHEFREIIAAELEKDEGLKRYYDKWGNKCFIFSAELGKNYFFSKDSGKTLKSLEINTQKLKEMGGEYVLSALEIQNHNEIGLQFEGVFTTPQSFFEIYLYKVK